MCDLCVGYIVTRAVFEGDNITVNEVFSRFENGEIVTSGNMEDVMVFEHKQMAEDVCVRLNEEHSSGWMVFTVYVEEDGDA